MMFARVTMAVALLLLLGACDEKKESTNCIGGCPDGWTCNEEQGVCEELGANDDDTDTDAGDIDKVLPEGTDIVDASDSEAPLPEGDEEIMDDAETPDIDTEGMECTPSAEEPCTYTGPTGTENIGPCKAGKRVCKTDGSGWTNCSGEVVPLYDLCGDGIDQNCDGTADNLDMDGDGVTECGGVDCCHTTEGEDGCPEPEKVYPGAPEIPNGLDDNCNDQIDEGLYDCDDALSGDTAMDYAKAIGLCAAATEGGTEWGVISAQFLMPDGTGAPHAQSHGILPAFGNVILPKKGDAMAMLTTGFAANPFDSNKFGGQQQTTGTAPGDWLTLNGNVFPAAPACLGAGSTGSVNDAVMLNLRVRAPAAAKSFSFNLYFFSQEYIRFVCSDYNDFFLTLLDSEYNDSPDADPNKLNPTDKNLAMDAAGNPVGVNLAPTGLFKQCTDGESDPDFDPATPGTVISTCENTDELAGTGFESYGGTGWLTTRGNVVGGEIIELRFVIWDTGPAGLPDYIYNSAVIIDNFEWQYEAFTPGTGPS